LYKGIRRIPVNAAVYVPDDLPTQTVSAHALEDLPTAVKREAIATVSLT
jgi:hypothetical protein